MIYSALLGKRRKKFINIKNMLAQPKPSLFPLD